jgi:hypothetical protein
MKSKKLVCISFCFAKTADSQPTEYHGKRPETVLGKISRNLEVRGEFHKIVQEGTSTRACKVFLQEPPKSIPEELSDKHL